MFLFFKNHKSKLIYALYPTLTMSHIAKLCHTISNIYIEPYSEITKCTTQLLLLKQNLMVDYNIL